MILSQNRERNRNSCFIHNRTWGLVIEPEMWRRHDQSFHGVQQVDVLVVGEPLEPKGQTLIKYMNETTDLSM